MTQPTTAQKTDDKKSTDLAATKKYASPLHAFLDHTNVRAKLAEVANAAMRPEDLVRLCLMAASRQPELLQCTQESVLRALMDAAALGIRPGGLMGRGYLLPRRNNKVKPSVLECYFDPGWRGLIDIARRSGEIKSVAAHVVYAKDRFHVAFGSTPRLDHEPVLEGDRGEIVAAYAIAEFKDGSVQTEVLTKGDIHKIRAVSAAENGPWKDWEDEMSRKSAVRRLCKYLPFDPILEKAIEVATSSDANAPMIRDAHFVPDLTPGHAQALEERLRGAPPVEVDPETGEIVPPPREV